MARGIKLRNYLSKVIPDSDVYIDQTKTKGHNWREINDKKLEEANIVLVILTPAALLSHEVLREVNIAKKLNKRIVPCKHDSLDLEWKDIPWDLGKLDGVKFEDGEILRTRLYKEINKIIKEMTNKRSLLIAEQIQFSVDISIANSPIPVIVNNRKFELPYFVQSGSLKFSLATVDKDSASILVDIECKEDSKVDLTLPRALIDSTDANADEPFFILVDGKEVSFTEKESSPKERTLGIPIPANSQQIEIIGKQLLGISFTGITKPENIIKILHGSSSSHGGKYLEPELLAIKVGEKVRWQNDDTAAHTITSGNPTDGPDGRFDSSLFGPGKSFEVTFNEKGNVNYHCMVHPWKIGKIIVE